MMGMYTELVFKASIRNKPPEDVRTILEFLFNGAEPPATYPEHPFFKLDRWSMIGRCSSYYHTPWAASGYHEGYIFSRSDLKNYSDEIAVFLDWIMPYIDEPVGKCIGWTWYEETDIPTLIFKT